MISKPRGRIISRPGSNSPLKRSTNSFRRTDDLRGKAFVSIENNVFHFVVSAPLRKLGFRGRYLNGEIALQPPPDGDPRGLEIKKIALSGVDVSERVLDFISGGHSLRSYIDQYSSDDEVTKVQIVGDKVILESRGGG